MFFVARPQPAIPVAPAFAYDPEEAYVELKRREYLTALAAQQERHRYEQDLAVEEQRHRATVAAIAQKEAIRRQREASFRPAVHREPAFGRFYAQPAPEEVLRRRQEVRRSNQIQEAILNQLFGLGPEESEPEPEPVPIRVSVRRSAPTSSAAPNKPTSSATETVEPHQASDSDRVRALSEISSVASTFSTLKKTFVFPTEPLERMEGSEVPRLAFTPTNATIHAYDHALSELLTKLDAIESFGFKSVRDARKQLVVDIEKELEELERKVSERLHSDDASTTPVVDVDAHEEKEVEDTVMEDKPEEPTTDITVDSAEGGYDVDFEVQDNVVSSNTEEVVPADSIPVVEEASHPEESSSIVIDEPQQAETEPTLITPPESSIIPPTLVSETPDSDMDSEIEDAVRIVSTQTRDQITSPDRKEENDEFELL